MNQYKFNELEAAKNFFILDPNDSYRKRIIHALKGKNYYYICFIEFALTYLVYLKEIKNYHILKKIVFRYLVSILYLAYRKTNKIFSSSNMSKLVKNELSCEELLKDFKDEDDIWSKVYNSCIYKNEFSELIEKNNIKMDKSIASAISQIASILYKQQSYFAGDQPLLNTIKEDKNNIVLLDELICNAINLNRTTYENKKSFVFEYLNEEKWKEFIVNKEHVNADLKLLTFVIKEAIKSNKTKENDVINVQTATTYRAIAGMQNGSYSNIRFLKYDKERGSIMLDYSLFHEPLRFNFDDTEYLISRSGISKVVYNSYIFDINNK